MSIALGIEQGWSDAIQDGMNFGYFNCRSECLFKGGEEIFSSNNHGSYSSEPSIEFRFPDGSIGYLTSSDFTVA